MKKILIIATAALCFAGNLSAVETAGGAAATGQVTVTFTYVQANNLQDKAANT